jgi:hypothetical protein
MSRRSASIIQQLVAARSAAAAACSQQQQLGAIGIRCMSAAANPNSKDGKVLHPDLLNDNLKKTQVRHHTMLLPGQPHDLMSGVEHSTPRRLDATPEAPRQLTDS